ncbi:MAG: HAMP domain-containing protein [Treponema sp.]|nr:HAMP domain-containing protein [Treponema sp.]
MSEKKLKTRVPFPIGAKLVIIITILLLASLGAVIFMVSVLSTQNVQLTAEENNFTVNVRAGSQAESSFASIQEAVLFYLEMLDRLPAHERAADLERFFFNHNRNIAAIGKMGRNTVIYNEPFLNANGISADAIESYLAGDFPAVSDTLRLYNASPHFNISVLTAVFIYQGAGGDESIQVLFSPEDLFESFSTGTNTSFIINNAGSLLLHPDIFLVLGGANFSSLPIVATMQQEGDNHRQISYFHDDHRYFGAYYRLPGMDAAVITVIPHNIVFEAIQSITRQNMFLTAAVLFITIGFIWFFSKTISNPARVLAAAALKIEDGDFAIQLTPQTRDELGLLTESFDKMSSALNIFGRFTNKRIAVRAMRGELKPGGLPKYATIFFSDIRSFTEKSENFTKAFGDDAPNRIVLWLNEYFSRMIPCVGETGGVVDKFIGDAVMAHWGTVFTAGSPEEDAFNCVKAALMMRESLIEFNASRTKDAAEDPIIRIGCGINSGIVIAGQIGSEERMEYTAIGDPVNLASRIETFNKLFGTDILITEDTWKLTGDKLITEEMLPVTVKGKEKPVRVFAVINVKESGSGPQNLTQLRALLGIETPDLGKLAIDEEEKKQYAISSHRQFTRKKASGDVTGGPVITMTSFGSAAWVKGPPGKQVPVFFSWNISDSNADFQVIVEIAADQDFNTMVEEREVINEHSVSIPLRPGIYWWRTFPANIGSRHPINESYPYGILVVDIHAK